MKSIYVALTAGMLLLLPSIDYAQNSGAPQGQSLQAPARPPQTRQGIRPYQDVITDKAITDPGLFIVHKVEDRYYFEIHDSLFNRIWMAVTRTAKVPTGAGYGGEEVNRQTLRWEKLKDESKILLRVESYLNVADESLPIHKAVAASNNDPIAASFDIKAYSKNNDGVVIDVTDFFKGDNSVVSISANEKRQLGVGQVSADRSFINRISSYPINTEVFTTKTFTTAPQPQGQGFGGNSLPTASAAGVVTFEVNTSMILLPKVPMSRRYADDRVGYFSFSYTNYGSEEHKTITETFIKRWRLEPKPEDVEKMKRGELVEPVKPIVYYIDPATPVKWRKYLIMGVNDWQKAFEKAGFKNAIMGKEWPENDTTMSLEDARYSVIRYFASDVQNAYGPNVSDPRSGEIIESHIGWYHNIQKLLRNWYMMQAGAADTAAQHRKFSDELMGQLIRFVSSHEVGHTIGLLHNFGSSSSVPVEKLRDKAWVEANGHTPSIMDYARFNYVAQPEDGVGQKGLFPRIGDYDEWAVKWGYTPIFDKTQEEQKMITRNWLKESAKNPRLIFLREGPAPNFPNPDAQRENVGDDAVLASGYGIKNLKRILPNLYKWSYKEGENFAELDEMYTALTGQLNWYFIHVTNLIGGIYERPHTYDQDMGPVFRPVPKEKQQSAFRFLHKEIFETPSWLIDWEQLKYFNRDQVTEEVRNLQQGVIDNLLDRGRLARINESTAMLGNKAYTLTELMEDIRKSIFAELYSKKPADLFKRNLQKVLVEKWISMLTPAPNSLNVNRNLFGRRTPFTPVNAEKTDILSVIKGNLSTLKNDIQKALPLMQTDPLNNYHLQDVLSRIQVALKGDSR